MRARVWAAAVMTISTGAAVLAMGAWPAPAGAAAGHAGGRPRGAPFNTGAAHSPETLRQLAGGAAIDWAEVAASGIQFAAVKATEGTYYRNPYARGDLAGARAAGLSVMAYAFAIPDGGAGAKSATAQADYLLSDLSSGGGPTPAILLDIEYNPYGPRCYGLKPRAMVRWIDQFNAEIRARTGQDAIIYTPPLWWRDCTGGSTTLGHLPLWVPGVTSADSPALPAGWRHWAFWQYTSAGTVPGVDDPGATDLDQLNPSQIPLLDPGYHATVAGAAVDVGVGAADPVAGRQLSYAATGLPAGLTISAGGRITGSPRVPGVYQVTVSASDSQGLAGAVSFEWRVRRAR